MNKKIIGILVMTLLITNVLTVLGTSNNLDIESNSASIVSIVDTVEDQSQEGNNNAHHLSVGCGGLCREDWQEFVPTMYKFEAVSVYIKLVDPGNMGGFLVVNIKEGDSGDIIWQYKADIDHVSTHAHWFTPHVTGEDVILVPGETYKIHLQIPNVADLVWYYVDGNPYTNGDSSIGTCCDFAFRTFAWVNNFPTSMTIDGPLKGKVGTLQTYTFCASDPDGDDVSYYVKWGDGTYTGWSSMTPEREPYPLSHSWAEEGTYLIEAQAKDSYGGISDWARLEVSMPKTKIYNPMIQLLMMMSDYFPFVEKILNQIKI